MPVTEPIITHHVDGCFDRINEKPCFRYVYHAWAFSCFHDFTAHTNVIQNAMECYLNEIIA